MHNDGLTFCVELARQVPGRSFYALTIAHKTGCATYEVVWDTIGDTLEIARSTMAPALVKQAIEKFLASPEGRIALVSATVPSKGANAKLMALQRGERKQQPSKVGERQAMIDARGGKYVITRSGAKHYI